MSGLVWWRSTTRAFGDVGRFVGGTEDLAEQLNGSPAVAQESLFTDRLATAAEGRVAGRCFDVEWVPCAVTPSTRLWVLGDGEAVCGCVDVESFEVALAA